jgi:hypothetical protein
VRVSQIAYSRKTEIHNHKTRDKPQKTATCPKGRESDIIKTNSSSSSSSSSNNQVTKIRPPPRRVVRLCLKTSQNVPKYSSPRQLRRRKVLSPERRTTPLCPRPLTTTDAPPERHQYSDPDGLGHRLSRGRVTRSVPAHHGRARPTTKILDLRLRQPGLHSGQRAPPACTSATRSCWSPSPQPRLGACKKIS